jgi:hypothetical protein
LAFEQFTESHSPLNSGKPRKFAQNAKSRIDWRITAEAAERFVEVEDLLGGAEWDRTCNIRRGSKRELIQ